MPKKKPKKRQEAQNRHNSEDFEQWAEQRKNLSAWDTWPDELKSDIKKVLELNDAGSHRITILDMTDRMSEVYGIAVSDKTVTRYVKVVLGRSSWARK